MKFKVYEAYSGLRAYLSDKWDEVKLKLSDLTATNYKLALHHLRERRVNDAMVRLCILVYVIDSSYLKSRYLLAQLLMIKGYVNQADKLLKNLQQEDNDFRDRSIILSDLLSGKVVSEFPQDYIQTVHLSLCKKDLAIKRDIEGHWYRVLKEHFMDSHPVSSMLHIGVDLYNLAAICCQHDQDSKESYELDVVELLDASVRNKDLEQYCDSVIEYSDLGKKQYDVVMFNALNYVGDFSVLKQHGTRLKKGGALTFVCKADHIGDVILFNNSYYLHSLDLLQDFCSQLQGFEILCYDAVVGGSSGASNVYAVLRKV